MSELIRASMHPAIKAADQAKHIKDFGEEQLRIFVAKRIGVEETQDLDLPSVLTLYRSLTKLKINANT